MDTDFPASETSEPPDHMEDVSYPVDDPDGTEMLRSETTNPASSSPEVFPLVDEVPADGRIHAALQWLVRFLVAWQSQVGLSDRALQMLFTFLSSFFHVLGLILPASVTLAHFFPKSVHAAKKSLHLDQDSFMKYVVCPRCHSLYDFDECFEHSGNRRIPRNCSHISHPNHPQRHHRRPCGAELVDAVTLKDGSRHYKPKKIYVYNKISHTLRRFVKRPGFEDLCEAWRSRQIPVGHLADVYDGTVWSDFQVVDGRPFLSRPRNYAFMLNVDWFCPYKHIPYSTGAIYMSLLNLPRALRNKKENIILVGLIPGPHEPCLTINSYLRPLVTELNQLWTDGLCCKSASSPVFSNRYRCALLCVSCDIPASRKVGGFLSHSARMGCNKCKTEFVTLTTAHAHGQHSLSRHCDRTSVAELRQEEDHRQIAEAINSAETKQEQEALERETGVRYSELLKLPYYRPIEFLVIDPMHNLFLGTAKTMLKEIWLNEETPLFTKTVFEKIQQRVDTIKPPSAVGRIPLKITSNFSGFTADQWKTWTTMYSPYALRDVLPSEHLQCWLKFVHACRLLCSTVLTMDEVQEINTVLGEFVHDVHNLYKRSTPNMHLHQHLCSSIESFGPTYAFWLFSFERLNGILGTYKTNNKSIEIQIMRKFLTCSSTCDGELPDRFQLELGSLLQDLQDSSIASAVGSVARSTVDSSSLLPLLHLPSTTALSPTDEQIWSKTVNHYLTKSTHTTSAFSPSELACIKKMYEMLLGPFPRSTTIPIVYTEVLSVEVAGVKIGSAISSLDRSSYILAAWSTQTGQIALDGDIRPGKIDFFLEHAIQVNGKWQNYLLASVSWYQSHPDKNRFSGTSIWCSNDYLPVGPSTFMPVQRVSSLFTPANERQDGDSVLFVLPHNRRFIF